MKHNFIALYQNILLRPIENTDIEQLRLWRNNSENNKYLRKLDYITEEKQIKWFNDYLDDKNEIIFAIEEIKNLNRLIGSVSLYNFKNNTAEVGKILIGDHEAHGKGIGRLALVMAMQVGFTKLNVKKYVGSVHQDNVQAHTNDLKVGFIVTGNHLYPAGGLEDEIELDQKRLKEVNTYVEDILIRGSSDNFFAGKKITFTKTITESDVYNFAGISGDFNPLHVNAEFSEKSRFKKRICHGMLVSSLISTCLGMKLSEKGVIYLEQNLKFKKPVYIGDTCTAVVTVIDKDDERNILRLDTNIINQDNEIVIFGNAKVKI